MSHLVPFRVYLLTICSPVAFWLIRPFLQSPCIESPLTAICRPLAVAVSSSVATTACAVYHAGQGFLATTAYHDTIAPEQGCHRAGQGRAGQGRAG